MPEICRRHPFGELPFGLQWCFDYWTTRIWTLAVWTNMTNWLSFWQFFTILLKVNFFTYWWIKAIYVLTFSSSGETVNTNMACIHRQVKKRNIYTILRKEWYGTKWFSDECLQKLWLCPDILYLTMKGGSFVSFHPIWVTKQRGPLHNNQKSFTQKYHLY